MAFERRWLEETPYEVLGLAPSCDQGEVKRAYRAAAKAYHPDRVSAASASDRMARINGAYAILKDPVERGRFDAWFVQEQIDVQDVETSPAEYWMGVEHQFRCSRCGTISSGNRLSIFPYCISFAYWTWRRAFAGIYCVKCSRVVAAKAAAMTSFLGWWSIPGVFLNWSPSVRSLLNEPIQPEDENRQFLKLLGLYFIARGDRQAAGEAWAGSLKFGADVDLAAALRQLGGAFPKPVHMGEALPWFAFRAAACMVPIAVVFNTCLDDGPSNSHASSSSSGESSAHFSLETPPSNEQLAILEAVANSTPSSPRGPVSSTSGTGTLEAGEDAGSLGVESFAGLGETVWYSTLDPVAVRLGGELKGMEAQMNPIAGQLEREAGQMEAERAAIEKSAEEIDRLASKLRWYERNYGVTGIPEEEWNSYQSVFSSHNSLVPKHNLRAERLSQRVGALQLTIARYEALENSYDSKWEQLKARPLTH